MDTTNTTDEDYEQVEEKKLYDRSIIYKVDNTFVKFVCSNDNKYNFLNISCVVDYIDYEKAMEGINCRRYCNGCSFVYSGKY